MDKRLDGTISCSSLYHLTQGSGCPATAHWNRTVSPSSAICKYARTPSCHNFCNFFFGKLPGCGGRRKTWVPRLWWSVCAVPVLPRHALPWWAWFWAWTLGSNLQRIRMRDVSIGRSVSSLFLPELFFFSIFRRGEWVDCGTNLRSTIRQAEVTVFPKEL